MMASESWRFSVGFEEIPNAALFVRDIMELDVPPGFMIPPHVAGPLPVMDRAFHGQEAREAGSQWADWWHRILNQEVLKNGVTHVTDQRTRLAHLADVVGVPPRFVELADYPALQKAAQTAFTAGCLWAGDMRRSLLSPHGELFDWTLTREVAEEVARTLRVGLGRVQAQAIVLIVEGIWWQRFAPGVILCSPAAALNPMIARDILQSGFRSGFS